MSEAAIRDCLPCQANIVEHTTEALKMSPLPTKAWSEISIDFADLPNGEHLLVVMDDYTRFPEVEIVPSTSAQQVIPRLDRIFASFGIPDIVRTDNGPPFNSHEFANYAKYLGFVHRKITPGWPQANGEVERFMKTLKKAYRTSFAESKPWKQELFKFLRNYRATPHSTTGTPPATLLFGRSVQTRLPEPLPIRQPPFDADLRERDQNKKHTMKTYADNRRKTGVKDFAIGDTVLVRRHGYIPKHVSPYFPHPYTVTRKRGTLVTVERNSHTITRNSSYFKKYTGPPPRPQLNNDNGDIVVTPSQLMPPEPPEQFIRHNPPRDRQPPAYLQDYVP